MPQKYGKPSVIKIHKPNQNVFYSQYALTALTVCEGESSIDCQGDTTPTVEFLFCAQGIKDGSGLEGCSLSLLSCPAELINCHTEPSVQSGCDSYPGGGIGVACSVTFDCTASCGGTPAFQITCGSDSPVPCPNVH